MADREVIETVPITEDGGITKEIYVQGEGSVPNAGDEIVCM